MNAPKSWDDVNQMSHLTWPYQIARIRAEYAARIAALEADIGKPISELVQSVKGGEQARADKAEALLAEAHAAGLREAAEIGRKALRDIAGMDLIGASAVAWNEAREIDAILARAAEGGSHE